MPRLLVLDLSFNSNLSELPEQISGLVSLRYLNLSWTKIKRLPVGLQELKMLIYLNLEWTMELERLQGISKLSSLRTLRLQCSNVLLDMSLMEELQLLEHLEFISISISSIWVGKLLFDPRITRCIKRVSITERPEESVSVLILPAVDNLCEIYIQNCRMWEIKIEKTPWNKSMSSPCFSNLSRVLIDNCGGLKDLTWLLFGPHLTDLSVSGSYQLEDIISKEKAAIVLEGKETVAFKKLEALLLADLPELKNIYWNALPFQCLGFVFVRNCPKLRKLPLDSKSVFKLEEFNITNGDEEWLERVEWEDEATRQRFLPSFRILT